MTLYTALNWRSNTFCYCQICLSFLLKSYFKFTFPILGGLRGTWMGGRVNLPFPIFPRYWSKLGSMVVHQTRTIEIHTFEKLNSKNSPVFKGSYENYLSDILSPGARSHLKNENNHVWFRIAGFWFGFIVKIFSVTRWLKMPKVQTENKTIVNISSTWNNGNIRPCISIDIQDLTWKFSKLSKLTHDVIIRFSYTIWE